MNLKKSISLLLTAAMLLTLPPCAPEEEINPVTPIATAESATTAAGTETTAPPETEESVRETRPPAGDKQPSLFDDYVSNTVISTGSNYMYPDANDLPPLPPCGGVRRADLCLLPLEHRGFDMGARTLLLCRT